jgi:hypothetical protein
VEKELLGLLVSMWYRRTILINLTTTRRRTSRRTPQRLSRQPILRRRTREIVLSAVILVISQNRKWKGNKKLANMVIGETVGTLRYGNILPTVLSVCYSPEWWIDTGANIHVCADISLFSSYQAGGLDPC